MYEETHGGSADIPDPNEMLEALVERLEDALQANRAAANGVPLFAVEAELTERLRVALPGVRFTAQDVRAWLAEISS
jgi:hypothetical protein